jgi:hypothetical protein
MELGAGRGESVAAAHDCRRRNAAETRSSIFAKRCASMWSRAHAQFGVGLRETNSSGAIGSDGGSTGPIEFVGVPAVNGGQPAPVRTLAPDAWTTLQFDLPAEPVRGFTGNGVLESTTGLGVLEHLAIAPGSASIDHDVYLDNFVVVENNTLTYSLIAPPPGHRSIRKRASSPGRRQLRKPAPPTCSLCRSLMPGRRRFRARRAFSVVVIPYPEIISLVPQRFALHFYVESGARRALRHRNRSALDGQWTVVGEVTASSSTASHSAAMSGSEQYYRARLK